MFFAYDSNMNKFHALDAKKGTDYFCKGCGDKLILRQGLIKPWHFAHHSKSTCVLAKRDMSEWHMRMQNYFDKRYQEVVIKKDNEIHRADIIKDGFVIEFQHSPISYYDFKNRTEFYTGLGYKMIWIFDANKLFSKFSFNEDKRIDFVKYERTREEIGTALDCALNGATFRNPLDFLFLTSFKRCEVSICFSTYDEDTNKDFVYNVYWSTPLWDIFLMDKTKNISIMSSDMALERLFWCNSDWANHFVNVVAKSGKQVKVKTIIRGGLTGFKRYYYLCKDTGGFSQDCEHCTNCMVIKQNDKGGLAYCNLKGERNVDSSYNAPTVFLNKVEKKNLIPADT